MPEPPKDDPILNKSYSFQLLLWSFLLMLATAWSLYDEMFALRPWRSYQARFAAAYDRFLESQIPAQSEKEKAIRESAEYQKLVQDAEDARKRAAVRVTEIRQENELIDRQVAAITETFQTARAKVTALVYQWEIAGESSKANRRKDVDAARQEVWEVRFPLDNGGSEVRKLNFDQLDALFNQLKDRRAQLSAERGRVEAEAGSLERQRDTYFQERLEGLTESQIRQLRSALRGVDLQIRQIHLESAGLVDRCQSCHVGMETRFVPLGMRLTKADLGMDGNGNAPFTSHPNIELLKIHDIERFGCSPCHGGNGRATSSIVKGHGRHKYWLWPLFYAENVEAGCQQCHASDMFLEHAPVLNRGKELFREKGCVGCHRYEGFDNEGEQLLSARQEVRQLDKTKREYELEIPRLIARSDRAEDNETARSLLAQATNLTVQISNIDARREQLERRSHSLLREEKKVGPSLKEVRQKLRKEWIPHWLGHTHEFRPATKMPQFRLSLDEVKAISAFIWQSGVTGPALQRHSPGNAARGRQLFESRGCQACHALGEGDRAVGGDFAANLSRVGEKAHYDYLVRWIHNPRERTRPYCPYEKRDLGPEDYAKHGLPFVFDLEHSRCPNDGHELIVQQPTVMPSLRLTWNDARDIASYLLTQRRPDFKYEPAEYMDDPQLKKQGADLVRYYGCAGCHEIATLEEEGRIGTELTTEGSKPIERLDFALLTHDAKRGLVPEELKNTGFHERAKWYDHKGFFEAKLSNPAIFESGKYPERSRAERLRMPKPNLTPADVTALTTFLLGSVDPQVPPELQYKPSDPRRDIQEGWWLVTKYNCIGCHQIAVGSSTSLQNLPQYQAENKDKLPPPLIGQGARVDPNWLARFLADPSLTSTAGGSPKSPEAGGSGNGVRPYLEVRMPTFSFSDNEIRKLVRFFEAMSSQAQPYLPPRIQPLSESERAMARQIFTHPAAPCLKCHATGDPRHDANATAPNFLLTRERLRPAWTLRWILDPAKIAPGTAMPSGLFRRDGDRWVFAGPLPPGLRAFRGDHADLLVRYMFELTPAEQRMLSGRLGAATGAAGNK